LTVISGGLSRRELLKLIGFWQRFAAREFGITVFVRGGPPCDRGLRVRDIGV
jgi:hypothetical protein